VLILCLCVYLEGQVLKEILEKLCEAIGMMINNIKYTLYFLEMNEGTSQIILGIFNFSIVDMQYGFKYFGFMLKHNNYFVFYWKWLFL
jgi:hypothetical protein